MLIDLDSNDLRVLTGMLQTRMIDCARYAERYRRNEVARNYWTEQGNDARLALRKITRARVLR